ncbi:hypothetical protein LZC95_37880 [Pendulispora brunnea]|uniref:Uncharacterized protein n=1 Tax=Pendulispora brunnea TaxID=2905690 RepID=A0ABZ2K4E0_9BACT
MLTALGALGGCASIGKMLGVGQPDALKGDIPFRVTNPPTPVGRNFSKPIQYSVCGFVVITPDGQIRNNWFGGMAAPPPQPGESKDYKIKPGVYRIQAHACTGDPKHLHADSTGQMDVEVKGPTEVVVVAPSGEARAERTAGFDVRVLRTGPWKEEQTLYCSTDKWGKEVCTE